MPSPARSLLGVALAFSLPFAAAAAALAAGFAVDYDGTLYAIRCAQSKAVKLGVVKCGGEALVLTDLGTTSGGALYGTSEDSLYKIDLKDPAATRRIGAHGLTGPYGFCIGSDDVGYVNTADGGFYTLDLASAKPTYVGPMGGGFYASGDLVFVGRDLLSSVKDAGGVETLVSIDRKTGKARRIGAITDGSGANVRNVFGLICEEGVLYGLTPGGVIGVIDPKTASASLIDVLGARFWGASDAIVEE